MKVTVTGGTGFIGLYCVERLIELGHQVIIYDMAMPPKIPAQWVQGDVLDHVKLGQVLKKTDAVLHLAGILGTAETIDDPTPSAKVNIMGSIHIYKFCRKFGIRACTVTVGNHFMLNSYAITKSCAERLALMYNREHGTQVAVVRGLNAYGPRQKHRPVRKVIPNFVLPALKGEPIVIYGDGEQVMDFIYVADLAQILCAALLDNHGAYDRIFEAGSGRQTTINHIAAEILRQSGSDSPIEYKPMRPGETPNSTVLADVTTLEPLGVHPERLTTLETGLGLTIQYYREHQEQYR